MRLANSLSKKIGGFLLFMISEELIPDKPFKTYEELLGLLTDRNVIIENNSFTIDCLSDYSYYDLINGYKNLYPIGKDDKFLIPVPFTEFYLLHNFDIALNNVILKYILLVEKSFKSKLSYIVSQNYGVQTDLEGTSNVNKSDYLCREHYIKPKMRNNILKSIKEKALERKDSLSVKHYLEHHNHLPCWILINSIPLGLAIKWYSILGSNEKQYITEKLIKSEKISIEEKKEFLKNALDILKQYRNNIAHGHKVFSSSIKEQLPKKQV